MARFAANLSTLFTEVSLLDRIDLAAAAGFRALEVQLPYAVPAKALRARLDAYGLPMVLHNLPAGDWEAGDRGVACDPARRAEFWDGIGRAIDYAGVLGVTQLNCLAGRAGTGTDEATARATLVENIGEAAATLRGAGLRLMIEPVNIGPEAAFARVQPLLSLMGKTITHVGAAGAGQVTKVANQIIVALTIAAVGEALVFASKAGAEPDRVRQALLGGFASSRVLEVHGARMLSRSFSPGFRIALHQKDLSLALDGARKLGLALPQTAGAAQLMQVMQGQGWDQLDHSALIKALELMGRHEIAPEHPLS